MMIRRLILFILFAALFAGAAAGQPTAPDLLAVDSAFVKGEYERVELLTLRLLQSETQLAADEAARLNLTTGYALIMLGREADARGYFARALDAVPDLILDPVQVSPKFRVVFDEVKADHARMLAARRDVQPIATNASESPERPRPQSLLANLALPGAGQWREGHRLRGGAVFAVQTAAAAALIWQLGELRDSRAQYLTQTDPVLIRSAYDDFNRDYRTAWAAGMLTGAIYLAAQADLILLQPRHPSRVQAALHPAPKINGAHLILRW